MHTLAAKLLVLLALLVQCWIGAGRGQVVCLSLHGGWTCPHRDAVMDAHGGQGHDHEEHAGCDGERAGGCAGHSHHEVAEASGGFETSCDCCVHVPVPDPLQTSRSVVVWGKSVDAKPAPSAALVALVSAARGHEGWGVQRVQAPDWSRTAQVLALKATRILV